MNYFLIIKKKLTNEKKNCTLITEIKIISTKLLFTKKKTIYIEVEQRNMLLIFL